MRDPAEVTILGIDPGLSACGWGALRVSGARLTFLASGTFVTPSGAPLAARLAAVFDSLSAVLTQIVPHEAAVEDTFVSRDAKASLKLGHARGIALLAPALAGLTVAEYAPNLVKKTVVGSGHADKRQIRVMVRHILPRAEFDSDHAADALAVAICHASHRGIRRARVAA